MKHREPVNEQWTATATLHDYLSDLRACLASSSSRVFVGRDPKAAGAIRVGIIVRLSANGHPCASLSSSLHTVPGVHMFIAWDPRTEATVTGFPIPGLSLLPGILMDGTRLDPGYPKWQDRLEVTR